MKNFRYTGIMLPLLAVLLSCEEDTTVSCDNQLSVTAANITSASCGQPTGAVMLSSSGQRGAVSYQLDNGGFQPSAEFTQLAPGSYQITARDEAGCTASTTVSIQDEQPDITLAVNTTEGSCGEATGSMAVEASGGNAPYTYSLDGTTFQNDQQFQQLEPGEYTVSVRDALGCMEETTALVASGISFSNTISDIISTNCAVSGCHNGTPSLPDFSSEDVIFNNADKIRNRTTAGTMPPPASGRSLTEEEIQQIACWADDGAPDN